VEDLRNEAVRDMAMRVGDPDTDVLEEAKPVVGRSITTGPTDTIVVVSTPKQREELLYMETEN